jgi:cell division protein FtsB
MSIGRAIKQRAKMALPPLVFLSLTGYFAWNVTQGGHGLQAYAQREVMLQTAKAEFAASDAEREAWERRVGGLRTTRLDPDTLDERARAMLNLADPTDIVLPYGQGKKLF